MGVIRFTLSLCLFETQVLRFKCLVTFDINNETIRIFLFGLKPYMSHIFFYIITYNLS